MAETKQGTRKTCGGCARWFAGSPFGQCSLNGNTSADHGCDQWVQIPAEDTSSVLRSVPKAQHTPGPWKVEIRKAGTGKGREVWPVSTFPLRGMIARVLSDGQNTDRADADAALIAAAPETAAERDRLREERDEAIQHYHVALDERNATRSINAELLEALRDVESKIVDFEAGRINWRPDDFLHRVRAAIAHAEGR